MRTTSSDRRDVFNVAKRLCKENNLNVDAANPAYGYLRLETVFIDGQTNFSFPVLQNQVYQGFTQNPTEQRLALQDNFVVNSKLFGAYFWNTSTKKPVSPIVTGFTPFNTPNGYNFGNVANIFSAGTEATMRGIRNEFWNSGSFKYSMDYNVIIPRWDAYQHFFVPRTNANFNGAAVDPATQSTFAWTMPSTEGLSDGFVPMEPNIVLSGGKNTEINYTLPFAMSFADLGMTNASIVDGTIQLRFVCLYRGILLQNTTNVK